MRPRLTSVSLAIVTLLLSLTPALYSSHTLFSAAAQTTNDRKAESIRLNNEGLQLSNRGRQREALERFQQALIIVRTLKEQQGEGAILNNMGEVYRSLGQYPKALEFYQQALTIVKAVGDRVGEGTTLNNIGSVYSSLGQYPKALEFYQQALTIRKDVGDRAGEGTTLNDIGSVYSSLGQYPKALEFYQQALAISKDVGARPGEGSTLNNIGLVYSSLGQYPKALEFYQQALAIHKEVGDRPGEGRTLNNIGLVYSSLGQYPKALEFYQQALAISKDVGARPGEGSTLNNIGLVYNSLGQYPKALEFYQQALVIFKEVGDRAGEGSTLSNIGLVYNSLGQYPKALEFLQQALAVFKEVGDRAGEGTTLNIIGGVYQSLGQYPKALEFLQQALAIHKEVGNRPGEGTTLNNIGFLLAVQKQPELAIVFYKQSVTTREAIRTDNRTLPQEQQEAYTKTIDYTYRNLADLLLKQDRILEAQQILDLLKVQELSDYLRNVRGTLQPLAFLRPEAEILKQYGQLQQSAIEVGSELAKLQKAASQHTLTASEEKRLQDLDKLQDALNEQFNQFTQKPEIIALTDQLKRTQEAVQLGQFDNLRRTLAEKGNAALLYPLILDDRLELILTLPNTAPLRRVVPVSRQELNQTILDFRTALQDPTKDAKAPAQKLYQWLIQPLESDLNRANIQTILYAPDGQLRYIPLAALHDGNQWLVQKYRINNITASSIDKFTSQPQPQLRILAGAFANASIRYTIPVGADKLFFNGLPAAGKEVETLTTIPGTVRYLDQAFSLQTVKPRMNGFSVVHLATHASFVPGQPEASFILFGDGSTANLKDIEKWDLQNVDLVVLSACETGVGLQALGKKALGDGVEVLGLGYQFQNRGARATIASLWQVDDGGTQILMDAFYAILQSNKFSKAEALRQAQIALITNNYQSIDTQRASLKIPDRIRANLPQTVSDRLNHPYYWAPFILIGNGL